MLLTLLMVSFDFEQICREIRFSAVRSRGPGGQNVNKVSSAAVLYWAFNESSALTIEQKHLVATKLSSMINREGFLFLRSDEFRDLEKNKSRCEEKLTEALNRAFFKPKNRRPTKPSRSSKRKTRQSKIIHSDTKKSRQKIRY